MTQEEYCFPNKLKLNRKHRKHIAECIGMRRDFTYLIMTAVDIVDRSRKKRVEQSSIFLNLNFFDKLPKKVLVKPMLDCLTCK